MAVDSEINSTDDDKEWKASVSSRRDIHISMISYLLEAISEFCVALSQTGSQMIISSCILGGVGSAGPALRSAALASVPPLYGGEILAAFELVNSISQLLAPLQGVLMTLLINSAPEVVFFLGATIASTAAVILVLVQEKDRYKVTTDGIRVEADQ